jgi:uncharacterized flavoprotein (TIGR03862 family)
MAGRGGLNLTHSEPLAQFIGRYSGASEWLRPFIEDFSPSDLRAWAEGLGEPCFIGSSGRVFPRSLKASPLLRAWLRRLRDLNVEFRLRQEWLGWDGEGRLQFRQPDGSVALHSVAATLLALGGASWPRLGSDGNWTDLLIQRGVTIAPLQPANCGFNVAWTAHFRDRFEGSPLKNIALAFEGGSARGDAMVTRYGIEGGAVYAMSSRLRAAIVRGREAVVQIDLRPDRSIEDLKSRLDRPRRGQSLSNWLRKSVSLSPVEIGLLREASRDSPAEATVDLARQIKSIPLRLIAVQPLARAISTAGGIALAELDANLMLSRLPGVFAAGEMLDWEAPTGGYLLQACFSTGVAAARGILRRLS